MYCGCVGLNYTKVCGKYFSIFEKTKKPHCCYVFLGEYGLNLALSQ